MPVKNISIFGEVLRRNSQSCILPSQTFQYLPTPISNSGSTTFIEIQPILQKGIQNCPIEGACEITTEQNFLNMEGTDWPTFGSAFSKLDKTLLCRLEMDIRNRIFWGKKQQICSAKYTHYALIYSNFDSQKIQMPISNADTTKWAHKSQSESQREQKNARLS